MKYLKYILFGFLFMFIFKIDVLAYGVDCHYDIDDWATCDIKYNGVDDPEISCKRINAGGSLYTFTFPQFISLKSLMDSEGKLACPTLYASKDGNDYKISVYFDLVPNADKIAPNSQSEVDNDNKPITNYEEITCSYTTPNLNDYVSFVIRKDSNDNITYANPVYEGPNNGSFDGYPPQFYDGYHEYQRKYECPETINFGTDSNFQFVILWPEVSVPGFMPFNESKFDLTTNTYQPVAESDDTDRNADTNAGYGVYLAYNFNSKIRRIILRKQSDGYEVVLDSNSKAEIKNLNDCDRPDDEVDWLTAINNRDEDNYPTYVIQTNDGYYFADYKPSTGSYLNFFIFYEHLYEAQIDNDLTNTCQIIVGDNFLTFLNNNVFRVIYIGVPIILILLTSFDFAKVVFIDDKEGIQKAGKRFGKRVIVAVLIYLVPTILIFISKLIGVESIDDCVKQLEQIVEEESS